MVHAPIQINQFLSPVENTRMQLIEEENDKIKGRRGFIFKGFKTERQRIVNLKFYFIIKIQEEYLKNRYSLYDKPGSQSVDTKLKIPKNNNSRHNETSIDGSKLDGEIINQSLNESQQILQPHMRYKARSDLERIWEEVNKNSYGRANKEIINNQFKMLENNSVNTKKKKNKIEEDNIAEEFMKENRHLNIKVIDNDKKQKTREQIKKEMNVEAKNLMSELHVKTHFKAATSLANTLSIFKTYIKIN
jgi:hypothetical protein